jgi:4-amino-4-deoxy-L-arabinose transferase-like glycosyltransferase
MNLMNNPSIKSHRISSLALRIKARLSNPVTMRVFIVLAGLTVSLVVYWITGVHRGGDAKRYLDGATNLLAHLPLTGKQSSYIGYILVVALLKVLNVGTNTIVYIQILIASLAGLAVYELGRDLAGKTVGLLAALFFIFNFDIVRWHTYLLTDSLYISFVIISTWSIHLALKRGKWFYLMSLLAIIFTALIRPNGWLFLIIAPIYWLTQADLANWKKGAGVFIILACILAGVLFAPNLSKGVQAERPDQWLKEGVIIWGYDAWRFPMPVDATSDGGGLLSGIRYGLNHPVASIGLALGRVAVEVLHIRPFYSLVHNGIVLLLMIPIYILSIIGYFRTRSRPVTSLLAIVIICHLALVGLFFADWDGRFILYVFPLFCVLASVGLLDLFRSKWLAGKRVTTPQPPQLGKP